jgi:hypothetical protein
MGNFLRGPATGFEEGGRGTLACEVIQFLYGLTPSSQHPGAENKEIGIPHLAGGPRAAHIY